MNDHENVVVVSLPPPVVHVPVHRVALRHIMDAVCAAHDVKEVAIRSKDRHKRTAAARHAVWILLREQGWSYPEVAREFDVDWTTVRSACKQGQR